MEMQWTLDTTDSHKIYGVCNSNKQNALSAIFIVHGLTSSMHDYALKRASDFFADHHDVYRFNLYDGREGGRALVDCTLETHAADLNFVLLNYAPRYTKIFLIGHSYGGPTIMIANPQNVTAVSLWDPSFDLQKSLQEFSRCYVKIAQGYLITYGVASLIGAPMYEAAAKLDENACIVLAKSFHAPLQVIHAGDGSLITSGKSYHSYCAHETRHDVVAGTTHNFWEDKSCDELLTKTSAWFDRFS